MDVILLMKKWVKLDLPNQGHMTHNGILITICCGGEESQKDIPSNLKVGKREIR